MPSILTSIAGGLALAASVSAAKYSTSTATTVVSTTGPVAYIVNSDIAEVGAQMFIPGALTVTFNNLPAYIYMETFTTGPTVVTSIYKSRIPVPSSKTTTSTAQTSVVTSAAPSSSSTAATPTIVTSNTATCCYNTGATYVPSTSCDGRAEGDTCGSFHTCVGGGCYWFNYDNMCGSINNGCNTDAGYRCVNGQCKDVLFDASNCGQAYEVCGDNYGDAYACYQGVCTNISTDDNNCGAVGFVCATGTGCKAGTCIDTTSDNENCSVVGYPCPDGTTCVNSVCQ